MREILLCTLAVLVAAAGIIAMNNHPTIEGFSQTQYCGNVLVQKGDKIVLKNTSKTEVPGVNPIVFDNLEDYVEYMQWLRSQGINCPVLYLREQYNAQNECSYNLEPDPSDPSSFVPVTNSPPGQDSGKLVDASHTSAVFNQNSYPGFDSHNQNIGRVTPLDTAYMSGQTLSANAMKPNWGGVVYNRDQVTKGNYKQDEVYVPPVTA
jgi:hypothetical protein